MNTELFKTSMPMNDRSKWVLFSTLLTLVSWVSVSATEPSVPAPNEIQFEVLTPVSDSFQKETAAAAATIPPAIWQTVQNAGWQVRVAEFIVDAEPTLTNDRPRGWPVDMTWQNTDAIHFPHERLLVLAEKRRTRKGEVVATSRVAGVLRHELGHAFDMTSGGEFRFRSAAPDFRQAYQSDIQRMAADQGTELAYYRQDSDAGRQEAFAEAFGILLGGGSDIKNREIFQASFRDVMAIVSKIIDDANQMPTTEAVIQEPAGRVAAPRRVRSRRAGFDG